MSLIILSLRIYLKAFVWASLFVIQVVLTLVLQGPYSMWFIVQIQDASACAVSGCALRSLCAGVQKENYSNEGIKSSGIQEDVREAS